MQNKTDRYCEYREYGHTDEYFQMVIFGTTGPLFCSRHIGQVSSPVPFHVRSLIPEVDQWSR